MISTIGRIKNTKTNTIYKCRVGSTGYYEVCISLGRRKLKKNFKIHKAVAETFIENLNNYEFVNHIDCNKLNNKVENLEWITNKDNIIHAIKNGLLTFHKCEDSKCSKLTN